MHTRPLRRALFAAPIALAAIAAPAQTPPAAGGSPHFEAVRQRLAIGGPLFVYVDIDGDVDRIGRDVAATIAAIVGDAPEGAALRQDYAALLAELGLTQIKAIGMSSAARADGTFDNRAFLYIPEPRRGLLAALGGPARPFANARLAPADTDLFVEGELDAAALLRALDAVAARFGAPSAIGGIAEAARAQGVADPNQIAGAAQSAELLAALKGRVTIALGLGAAPPIDPQAPEQSALGLAREVKLLVRVEGIGAKLAAILDGLDVLAATSAGPRRLFRPKEAVQELGDNQPVIAIEGDVATIASSLAHLESSLARASGLDAAPAFRAALEATAAEGNAVFYATPRLLRLLRDAIGMIADASGGPSSGEAGRSVIDSVLGPLPAGDLPLISVTANVADGILVRSRAGAPLKGALLALGLYNPETVGTIARVVAPAIARAWIAPPAAADDDAAAAAAEASPRDRAVLANLRRIGEAADRYFEANPAADAVDFAGLLQLEPTLAALAPVAGEDYADVVVARDARTVEVELSDGTTVAHAPPLTDEERETVRRNLAAMDEAAAWYLATRPEEAFMGGGEAVSEGSPLKAMPNPVRGENYESVNVSRRAGTIGVRVAGEQIEINRDATLTAKYEEDAARHAALVEENLARIYAAARQTFARDKDALVVRGRALIGTGKPIPAIERVAGENYENVVVWRNYAAVSIEVPGRGRVAHRAELDGAAREAIIGNLRSIGRAANGWFERNPNERFVVSGELMGGKRPIAKPIVGQYGEDYTDIFLGRDYDEVKVRLPSGQVLSVERPR